MRCDANISLAGGARVEVKNISSFKEVEKALNYEILRQRTFSGNATQRDEALGREEEHNNRSSLEGGGAGLPVLPRAGPPADRPRTRLDSKCAQSDARGGGCKGNTICEGVRPLNAAREESWLQTSELSAFFERVREPPPRIPGDGGPHRRASSQAAPRSKAARCPPTSSWRSCGWLNRAQ